MKPIHCIKMVFIAYNIMKTNCTSTHLLTIQVFNLALVFTTYKKFKYFSNEKCHLLKITSIHKIHFEYNRCFFSFSQSLHHQSSFYRNSLDLVDAFQTKWWIKFRFYTKPPLPFCREYTNGDNMTCASYSVVTVNLATYRFSMKDEGTLTSQVCCKK